MTKLYEKHNYLNKDITMLKSTIKEFDMADGGFSLIQEFKLLPEDIIEELKENYDKQSRHIAVGKLLAKDKKLSKNLMDSFIEARRLFFESNNLQEENILSIKKDAIFVVNTNIKNTTFGDYINFRPKNKYSSYIYLNGKEFLYSIWDDRIDVKGLSNIEHPLVDSIKYFLNINEKLTKQVLFRELKKFRSNYLQKELDLDIYRELNNKYFENEMYSFKLKNIFKQFDMRVDTVSDDLVEYIDISYNYINYIVPLISNLI